MKARRLLLTACLVAVTLPAAALDYRSVAEVALLYDAPSTKAHPLFIVARYTPVEVVVANGPWLKVRDAKGDLSWVERAKTAEQRTVMVKVDRAQVRAQADDKAMVIFEAERDVALDLTEAASPGWAKVKHRDGQQGYVKATQVWGL